jgi:hypothetical protein
MEIYIYDDLQAEDSAMLQALYSKSSDSVTKHIEKVKETGSDKFMEKFYIGYGQNQSAGSNKVFGIHRLKSVSSQTPILYCS